LILSEQVRFSLLERLAVDFYSGRDSAIGFNSASDLIANIIEPPRGELEAYTREFLTCSFLVRSADEYRFSHSSIMEFLVATALHTEIERDDPKAFGSRRLPPLVADFLAELKPSQDSLWKWLKPSRFSIVEPQFMVGNAITILCRMDSEALAGRNLSGLRIVGADFGAANLGTTRVAGCLLVGCNLLGASYPRNITEASLSETYVRMFILTEQSKRETAEAHHNGFSATLFGMSGPDVLRDISVHGSARLATDMLWLWRIDLCVNSSAALTELEGQVAALAQVRALLLYSDQCESFLVGMPLELRRVFDRLPFPARPV
jgi:hypothetical protein